MTIHSFEFIDIDGKKVKINKFNNGPILLVNTASRCGFTPQYEGLQNLFINYRQRNLTIIAATSNSFNQEFDTREEIKKICLANYDVGFVVSSPINVIGNDVHPLYKWINQKYNKKPKWNFYKYLFDKEGNLVDSWGSMTKPDNSKITSKIEKLL